MKNPPPSSSLVVSLKRVLALTWAVLAVGGACTGGTGDGPAGDPVDGPTPPAEEAPDAGEAGPADAGGVSTTAGLVATALGDVEGTQLDNGTWRFLGVPFAQPPTGERRWRAPEPLDGFEEQPLVADEFGPVCPQLENGEPVGDEDCLHLNVWAPETYAEPTDDGRGRPVLFFLHGGANILGSTSQALGNGRPTYSGKEIAALEDVIVVTAQYRLGPLGFLALPELSAESPHGSSGNYAHLDQIAALQWVQDHIAGFGGDPDRVLVFGQSAGAINTCVLYASPLASGLLSSALMQSGFCPERTLAAAEAQHDEGVALLEDCVDVEDRLGCLRGLPASTLISVLPGSISVGIGGDAEGGAGMIYGPVVDGYVLPDAPLSLIERGEHNDVPVVVGSTAAEMASETIFPLRVESVDEYEAHVRAAFAVYGDEVIDEILRLYPAPSDENAQEALVQLHTDRSFTRAARRVARAAASGGTSSTYRYLFSKQTETPFATLPARHGIDLLYVFHTLASNPMLSPSAEDLALTNAMTASWAALARDGDPNAAALGVPWAAYRADTDPFVDFDAEIVTGEGLRTEKCDFWDALDAE